MYCWIYQILIIPEALDERSRLFQRTQTPVPMLFFHLKQLMRLPSREAADSGIPDCVIFPDFPKRTDQIPCTPLKNSTIFQEIPFPRGKPGTTTGMYTSRDADALSDLPSLLLIWCFLGVFCLHSERCNTQKNIYMYIALHHDIYSHVCAARHQHMCLLKHLACTHQICCHHTLSFTTIIIIICDCLSVGVKKYIIQ